MGFLGSICVTAHRDITGLPPTCCRWTQPQEASRAPPDLHQWGVGPSTSIPYSVPPSVMP